MTNLFIPNGYASGLDILQTEQAIKELRVYFEDGLAEALNLQRASAPLFVTDDSGLNDNLNGVERPVAFDILEHKDKTYEIVQSLAKWKRFALGKYSVSAGKGIYTNMNAIRRDEITDNLHSIYVDQWDWEKVITKEQRTMSTLRETVNSIYSVIKKTEDYVCKKYSYITPILPQSIYFVTTQEMEDRYPELTPQQRETAFAREYKAIFIAQIGGKLKSGNIHDGRAADYDDWGLNGDIVLYYPMFDKAFEISSMGIRVDELSIVKQLGQRGKLNMLDMPFQKAIKNKELPYTIGGGIGQSRLCMYMLRKAHIGEVQVSVWPSEMEQICKSAGIHLL